jgi:hypothetical protein
MAEGRGSVNLGGTSTMVAASGAPSTSAGAAAAPSGVMVAAGMVSASRPGAVASGSVEPQQLP